MKTSHEANAKLLINIFKRVTRYLKDTKNNGPYFVQK